MNLPGIFSITPMQIAYEHFLKELGKVDCLKRETRITRQQNQLIVTQQCPPQLHQTLTFQSTKRWLVTKIDNKGKAPISGTLNSRIGRHFCPMMSQFEYSSDRPLSILFILHNPYVFARIRVFPCWILSLIIPNPNRTCLDVRSPKATLLPALVEAAVRSRRVPRSRRRLPRSPPSPRRRER